tara:strand:- start:1694 stop:2011 length:318 start_codon:yes stop_codon:yes gene_type:complete
MKDDPEKPPPQTEEERLKEKEDFRRQAKERRKRQKERLEKMQKDEPPEAIVEGRSSVPWRNSVPLGPWTMEHIHLSKNLKADESEELTPEEKLRRHLRRNLKANE